MLLVESKTLAYPLADAARLRLLDELQAGSFTPLIRSMRRRCFELLGAPGPDKLADDELVHQLESQAAHGRPAVGAWAYTPGEIFCFADHILFLLFGAAEAQGVQAGVIFNIGTV